jgi:hypothetical protein
LSPQCHPEFAHTCVLLPLTRKGKIHMNYWYMETYHPHMLLTARKPPSLQFHGQLDKGEDPTGVLGHHYQSHHRHHP